MSTYWSHHPNYTWWLDNGFWGNEGLRFTCYHDFNCWVWMIVPKLGLDECNKHHLSLILVESSCRSNVLKAFGFTKGWILLWKVHWPRKWVGEDLYSSWWKEIWCFNFSFQNYYEKQPCYYGWNPRCHATLSLGYSSKLHSIPFCITNF